MSPFKILLTTSAVIIAGPFHAIPFPNQFPLFLYSFPSSKFPIEIIRGLYPFDPQHIQYFHYPYVVMRPMNFHWGFMNHRYCIFLLGRYVKCPLSFCDCFSEQIYMFPWTYYCEWIPRWFALTPFRFSESCESCVNQKLFEWHDTRGVDVSEDTDQ